MVARYAQTAALIRLELAASVRYWNVRGFDNKR
jgi:hypothetical protein